METAKTKGLSTMELKWLALALMVLDHIHYFFAYTGCVPEWFSMAGRLAAPLFLFCLAEGFSHTHDRKRYFLKVYGLHLFMSGLLFLMMCGLLVRPDGFYPMNGMMTSFAILMVVFQGMDWLGEKRWGPGLAAVVLPLAWPLLAGLLIRVLPAAMQMPLLALGYTLLPLWNSNPDASISVILTGVILYGFRRNRRTQAAAFAAGTMALSFLLPLLLLSQSPEFHWSMMFTTAYEWYGVLAVLPMLYYNGERGRGPKRFFYVFYPAHVYLLYALSWLPFLPGAAL